MPKEIKMEEKVNKKKGMCPKCDGTGYDDTVESYDEETKTSNTKCLDCKGTGFVEIIPQI